VFDDASTAAGQIVQSRLCPPEMAVEKNAARRSIQTIEWHMLDKNRFYPYSMASSFTVRCFLYPLTLVRTRLQVQLHNTVYNGTFDAFKQILHNEGPRGFYRGFWISCFQVVSGVCYVSTYEGVRHILSKNGVTDNKVKAVVGGAAASLVGQTIIVPFDVISQHLMILGAIVNKGNSEHSVNPLAINTSGRTRGQIAWDVTRAIYYRDGPRGFYRGYVASLCNYVPSSAAWWFFYHLYKDILFNASSEMMMIPFTGIQCMAAIMSGCSTSVITNPLDLVRARVQVQRRTIPDTIRHLWLTERFNVFSKGLTARMASSSIYSLAAILGYESVKKLSVVPEYQDSIHW